MAKVPFILVVLAFLQMFSPSALGQALTEMEKKAKAAQEQAEATQEIGHYDEAIQKYSALIDSTKRELGRGKRGLGHYLVEGYGYRAKCLKETSRYAEALRDYDDAIWYADSMMRSPYGAGLGNMLKLKLNKSDLLIQTGAYQEACRVLSFECSIDSLESRRVANMACAKLGMGQKDEAIALMDSVLSIQSISEPIRAAVLQNRGYAHMSEPTPDYGSAVADLREASKLIDGFRHYVILSNLAIAEASDGMVDDAIRDVDAALDGMKKAKGSDHPDYLRVLRKKAEILMSKGREEAYDIYETYFDGERRFVTDNFAQMTEQRRLDLWKMEKPLISRIFALEDYAPEFLLDVALFRREIALLGQADSVGREDRIRKRLSIRGKDVRDAMGKGEVLLDFVRYEKDSVERYGVIIAPSYASGDAVKFVPLWTAQDLEDTALPNGSSLGEAVRSSKMSDKDAIYADTTLANKVWSKILPYMPDGSDVYFAPDGLLHILAIENLPIDEIPSFSGMAVSLHRVTSGSVLLGMDASCCQIQEALVAGGLDYDDVGDGEIAGMAVNHDALEELDKRLAGQWRFARLPGMAAEADSVSAMVGGVVRRSTLFEEEVKRDANKYGLIHLSTHGYALDIGEDDSRPFALMDSVVESRELLASGLVFSGANCLRDSTGREDGILSARELCDMDLHNVDFIVLGACQTAMGGISDEGPAGIVRGLKKAGVKTVVATLWSVDDYATCAFMTHFYKALANGMTKSEAMDDTRRWMRNLHEPVSVFDAASMASRVFLDESGSPLESNIYERPRYWAAFILIDDVKSKN